MAATSVDLQLVELEHQVQAVNATMEVFEGVTVATEHFTKANPLVTCNIDLIETNIARIQAGETEGQRAIKPEHRGSKNAGYLGIDIHMETGTGKTYTYVRTMYEMHKHMNVSKFIVVVPSVAIKQGTVDFLTAHEVRRHFKDKYNNVEISVGVVEPRKGKVLAIPQAVNDFYNGSTHDQGIIHVLVINSGMLQMGETSTLNRSDYDGTLGGYHTRPYDALKETKPIVIMDEPHRFKRTGVTFKVIAKELEPQVLIRYGATFPHVTNPTARNPEPPRDFDNLVYSLGSLESFNKGLVKGVDVRNPASYSDDARQFRLVEVSGTARTGHEATFQELKNGATVGRTVTVTDNEDLAVLAPEFHGLTIQEFNKKTKSNKHASVELSNDQVVYNTSRDLLINELYSIGYTEAMLKQAIEQHFENEEKLFFRTSKIKALTLFFIDSVYSYRDTTETGQPTPGYLAVAFEKHLQDSLKKRIKVFSTRTDETSQDYLSYLQATLADVSASHGGYFSADNSTSDEAIQHEVELILNGKRQLISFKNDDGSWNTMRFVFSKWTLKEGWDNPNVFQIAKLRSSGSEISKLQEVGRGLRLPVDETGQRVQDENFHLTYFVDYSEKEFAEQLKAEILKSLVLDNVEDNGMLATVAEARGISEDELFGELLDKEFIDRKGKVRDENREQFLNQYPEFDSLLKNGVIIDRTSGHDDSGGTGSGSLQGSKLGRVTIRKPLYQQLRALWESLNKKYIIKYDEVDEDLIQDAVKAMLDGTTTSQDQFKVVSRKSGFNEHGQFEMKSSIVNHHNLDTPIPYGEFLHRIAKRTHVPIDALHRGLVSRHKESELSGEFFTSRREREMTTAFYAWFEEHFFSRHKYTRVEAPVGSTKLTDINGEPLSSIAQGLVGNKLETNKEVPETFLYDQFIYDSTLELENIENTNSSSVKQNVVVFAKIPSNSIRIPHYFGGTTSPDFMYVLTGEDGESSINFVIESKSYSHEHQLQGTDERIEATAKQFFEDMNKQEDVEIDFHFQLKTQSIIDIISETLSKSANHASIV